VLPEPEPPQLTDPNTSDNKISIRAVKTPRRLPIRRMPIKENGSTARKIDFAKPAGINLAVVPLPPVVSTDNFTVGAVTPSRISEAGETEQFEPTGPEQANVTVSLAPAFGVTVSE
jgi:hypothetical protein